VHVLAAFLFSFYVQGFSAALCWQSTHTYVAVVPTHMCGAVWVKCPDKRKKRASILHRQEGKQMVLAFKMH